MRALLRSFGVMLAALWLLDATAQLPTPEVQTFKLSMSNVHSIKGARTDRTSTRLNSSHVSESRMPSSA